MLIIDLTKEAIEYCKKIRGENYNGCGTDSVFCGLCRTQINSLQQLNENRIKINKHEKTKCDNSSEHRNRYS